MIRSFENIFEAAKALKPARLVTSFREADLDLICRAAAGGFIIPLLAGNRDAIARMNADSRLASLEYKVVEEEDPKAMLRRAISMIRERRADIIMQGGFNPNAFLAAVLDPGAGLKKAKTASYVSLFELTESGKLILITDTFINNHPELAEKRFILENALSLSALLGIESPKVAVLAAIEQVNPGIPSTLDAAILSKMSERGQFGKALVEGPLDIDCALSPVAAKRKGIQSDVTGNVDIYLVPEIDTGYLLAESFVCFGRIRAAGIVMGTTNPVIPDVPFVTDECRLVEIALASLALDRGGRNGQAL
jgi:phosphate butyryltransferase